MSKTHNESAVNMTGAKPEEVELIIKKFHYSKRMPGNIQHIYVVRSNGGLFGDFGRPLAAAIFSIPPTRWSEPVIELTRLVREDDFHFQLSSLIAFSCKRLKINGWNLAVSFADWTQRHHGGIYQACGWNYAGCRNKTMDGILIDGVFKPGRSCNSMWGTRSPEKLRLIMPNKTIEPHYDEGKHLYWKSLTKEGKKQAARMKLESLKYPKPNSHDQINANDGHLK